MSMADPVEDRELARQRLRLWVSMLKSVRSIETELRGRLRSSFDTTLPRFDVLAALHTAPRGLTMTDLSQQLMVSNGNVTGIVDRLVADGMALRQNEETDRRAFRISLTEAGRAKMTEMLEEHHGWIDEFFAGISEHDLARGIAIMMDLRHSCGRAV
ncbi:MarR family transcriptional regulator [Pseudomonas sp. GX19020]|uniref:MarR family winged helix-turn-helix transcriptional regulator n=1 Tax=Pseudomonas sp. GX19020 TaxID=2942277 RepID=UPI002019E3A0|nr:MarR family transcriptional regulator [Pseudomonas sp. GX19020]MCL4067466.1 MarR family transcriptional regulator [Pseudomonas sp. GX19020]